MLTIASKGQTEALSHYTGYELFEEVNGASTLSLTSFSSDENPGHELVEEEAVITVEDGRTFRVKQLTSTRNRKKVQAISTFFDLTGHIKDEMFAGTKTFSAFANWLFQGTGWTYEIVGIPSTTKLIANYGNDNFTKLLEVLISTWKVEREIMPGNHVILTNQIGPDNEAQYRYAHNIKTLSKSVDTTNLRTSITAYGGDGLKVTYTSPNAALFPHAGAAESFTDERFLIADNLVEEARRRLVDHPEVTIELEALELTEKALGERIWTIYEPLGIEFQTRILSKTTREPKEKSSAVIGSTLPRSLSDQLIEQNVTIDENAKQAYTKFEQTNERITLEAGHIRTYTDDEVGKVRETATANFNVLAGSITSAVSTAIEYTDTQTRLLEGTIDTVRDETDDVANNLGHVVDDLGTLSIEIATLGSEVISVKQEATADFNILSGSITSAVSTTRTYAETVAGNAQNAAKGYTDGLINTVVSTATSNFNILSGRINGKAESTTVSALGTRVNTVEFDMNAIEGSISQMVTQSDISGNQLVSRINQSATTIDIQASKINLVGAVTVLSELSGNLGSITAGTITGTTIRLDNGGLLDLRSGTILWGVNIPQANYAETAGNANLLNGSYTYRDFSLSGHVHSIFDYVKPRTSQGLQLWRNGTKVRVYQGDAYTELTGVVGSD